MAFRIVILVVIIAALVIGPGCDRQSDRNAAEKYATPPTEISSKYVVDDGDTLTPVRLQFYKDTLYVAYSRQPRIDLLSPELELVRTIPLTDQTNINPSAFEVSDSLLVVVSHAQQFVIIYDTEGRLITSFGTLPDGKTSLRPFDLTCYGGVAYITDAGQKAVLAVSLVTTGNLTALGELILRIPSDSLLEIGFPSAVMVTPDGRLMVGDATAGEVKVFTCDGRYIYDFDSVSNIAAQGFAWDNVKDYSLQDSSSWDPSGVRNMGRIHVVDGRNRKIHMFNPLGSYVNSYSIGDSLSHPADIAIDRKRRTIYIADPEKSRIVVMAYGEPNPSHQP